MPIKLDLWGNPSPEPAPPPRKKYVKPQRFANQFPTDVLVWLSQNEPATFDELMDLRLALYSAKTQGQYRIISNGQTLAGEEKLIVRGPTGYRSLTSPCGLSFDAALNSGAHAANCKELIMKKTKKRRIRDYEHHLRGMATNRFGGNKLQRERGLRGGTYGPANSGRVYSEEERAKYENALRERGDVQ